MKPGYLHGTDCRPVAEILSRIGDKWSVMLVMELHGGTRRFSELRRALHGISQKMLTTSLRGLERDGLGPQNLYRTPRRKTRGAMIVVGCRYVEPLRTVCAVTVLTFSVLNRSNSPSTEWLCRSAMRFDTRLSQSFTQS